MPHRMTLYAPAAIFGLCFAAGLVLIAIPVQKEGTPDRSNTQSAVLQVNAPDRGRPEFGDQYGGTTAHVQKGTGYFTVAKIGNRWTFVTPEGNAFWLRSVYHAIPILETGVLQSKYHGDVNQWSTQRNRRLLAWGFNALGEYTAGRGVPIGYNPGRTGNPVKLPFLVEVNALLYSADSRNVLGLSSLTKNVVRGVPRSTYRGWPGRTMDMFDPQLPQAYRAQLAIINRQYNGELANTPWIIGITPDDSDYMFGLKAEGHPHAVFLIACTKFSYTSTEDPNGHQFKDPKLYSKYAWVDFLQKKYGTIVALNKSWGSDYLAFGDEGGYGDGRGLLDEDGRHHSWMGSAPFKLSDAKPAVRADMDAFLYELARHYAETAVTAIRRVDRNHLIFSTMCLNPNGNANREQVLRGMADGGIQVFCLGYDPLRPDLSGDNRTYDITGKPTIIWYGVSANRDSAVHIMKAPSDIPDFPTQEERAAAYGRDLRSLYGARGKNGDAYIIGINFWELNDSYGERTNWGLLTRKDNAYDGKEAVRGAGTDAWGYKTGGEDQNYGDFLSTVRRTNFEIQDQLTRDLSPFTQGSTKSKK